MSTNTEIIKGAYEAFARRDVPGVLGRFATDIEWISPVGAPNGTGGVFKGHDELAGFFGTLAAVYGADLTVTPAELLDAGVDRVVALGALGAKSASGAPVEARFLHLWTLADDKAVRFEEFFDTAEMTRLLAD